MDVDLQAGLHSPDSAERIRQRLSVFGTFLHDARNGFFYDAHRIESTGPSHDLVTFTDTTMDWDTQDSTTSVVTLATGITDLFRYIAIFDLLFIEGLLTWWAMGLNLATHDHEPESAAWFSTVAAFRSRDGLLLDGFMHFGAVNVALMAFDKLIINAQPAPPSATMVELNAAISALIERRYGD